MNFLEFRQGKLGFQLMFLYWLSSFFLIGVWYWLTVRWAVKWIREFGRVRGWLVPGFYRAGRRWKFFFILMCFAVYTCAFIGFTSRGGFLEEMLEFLLFQFGIWIALGLIVVGLFLIGVGSWFNSGFSGWAGTIMVSISFFILTQFLTVPLGSGLAIKDIDDAKNYCEDLVPRLQEYQLQTGRYPEKIEGLIPWWKPRPRLIEKWFYYSKGDSFSFSFSDPRGWNFSIIKFSSDQREWVLYED